MSIYYPRSFPGLLGLGFTLVAVPLIIALVNNAVTIDQLFSRSQSAVYQGVRATENSRRLAESLTALERSARQILILGDRSLFDTYELNRKQFLGYAAAFTAPPFDDEQMHALRDIVNGEAAIYRVLSNPASKFNELQAATARFADLGERGRLIAAHSNVMIDREVQAMREAAETAKRITLWQMLAVVPLAMLLAVGFAILITRPIRQLDAAIRDLGDGRLDKAVKVGGPVDLRYLGERLDWMRRKLCEVEEQKTRFLQQVSHELKTPLTALREGTELLRDGAVGALTDEQREITGILHNQGLKLQKLIEALLAYTTSAVPSRHAGAMALSVVNTRQLVERVAADQKLALQARNLNLQAEVEDISLVADFDKLRTLLDNLVSNAVKFSPPGSAIRVSAQRSEGQVEFTVTDQGPGIAAEDRPRVFDPLYQGRAAGHGPVKGTGMGLSIVRDLAAAHGGGVDIDGTCASGARLRVRLPLITPEARAA